MHDNSVRVLLKICFSVSTSANSFIVTAAENTVDVRGKKSGIYTHKHTRTIIAEIVRDTNKYHKCKRKTL